MVFFCFLRSLTTTVGQRVAIYLSIFSFFLFLSLVKSFDFSTRISHRRWTVVETVNNNSTTTAMTATSSADSYRIFQSPEYMSFRCNVPLKQIVLDESGTNKVILIIIRHCPSTITYRQCVLIVECCRDGECTKPVRAPSRPLWCFCTLSAVELKCFSNSCSHSVQKAIESYR